MKRKLIEYDVFARIEKDSLSSAQHELKEAEQIVCKALNVESAHLRCFGPEKVVYETVDGDFIHANYEIKGGYIHLENIEQLVIDEETEHKKTRSLLGNLFDAIMTNQNERADGLFDEFMGLSHVRREFTESTIVRRREVREFDAEKGKQVGTGVYKKVHEKKLGHKEKPSNTTRRKKARKISMTKRTDSNLKNRARQRSKIKLPGRKVNEWASLTENVFNYLDYKQLGPALRESAVQTDDRGNVVSVRVPTKDLRNEAKLLSFNWKTLNTDVMVKRSGAKMVAENMDFCKAVAALKRQNAISDNAALEEALENIVTNWPGVLYLTQSELADSVKTALEYANSTNYDDQTCEFMAEGILRMAHGAYVDRVEKIIRLSGSKMEESTEDKYASFKKVVDNFFPHLDQTASLEMQVFVDLYEAIRQVYEIAREAEDGLLSNEAASHLTHLLPILDQQADPSIEVASEAAEWLYDLIESNLEGSEWNVSNSTHQTVNGDHPQMSANAKKGYTPSSDFSGDWGGTLPVSDGKSYKNGLEAQMRDNSWGNIGGSDTYPSLSNPNIPAPYGKYEIKGEKTIDADCDHLAHWSSGDTWPGMTNPYLPKAETPDSYKMNHGKEADLVVDK